MSRLELDGRLELGTSVFSYQLDVDPGEHVAIVGPNGAGKSTLLRVVAGLERLGTGSLTHGSTVLDRPDSGIFVAPHLRPCALQPQSGALFPHLDVAANVAFALRVRGMRRRQAGPAAMALLDRVGAASLAAQDPATLSGGETARVALARSLAAAPEVLLLDEPAAALDVQARAELRRLVAGLDQTVLTITHDPLEAMLLGRRLVVLEAGTIVQAGTTEEVAAAPSSPWIAGFTGVNIVTGTAHDTTVVTRTGAALRLAERAHGPVHVAFPANAVILGADRPRGSARNVFEATVTGIMVEGDRVRVTLDAGFEATAVVTAAAARELDLRPGGRVWASVKATELTVLPA